ncbi:hypothetical protein ACW7BJ_16365 [Azospirillum argentinense]
MARSLSGAATALRSLPAVRQAAFWRAARCQPELTGETHAWGQHDEALQRDLHDGRWVHMRPAPRRDGGLGRERAAVRGR